MPVELRPYTNVADLIAPPRIPEAPLPPVPGPPRQKLFEGDMMGLGALLPLMGPLLTARVGMDAVKGAQLPGDVYSGKVQVPFGSGAVQGQPASPEFVQGALGMLDLVPLGAAATVPRGALRSGAARQAAKRTKVPAGLLDSASPGAQFARGYPDVGPPNLMLDMGAGTVPKTTKIKPKGGAKAHGPPQQRVRAKVPDPVLLAEAVPSWQQMPDRWRRPRGEKPKKPNPFWQKNKTPSELKLEKLRTEANKKVNAGDYEPYYDVTKRTDVDSTKYPDRDSTITQMRNDQGKVKAPNAKSRARREIIRKNKPLIERRLRHFYGIGDTDPGSANWYFMGQLEKDFIEEYGEQQGRQLFQARFARPMAATTGGQTPTANLLMSHYGAYQEAAGRAIPIGHQIPTPLGGRFLAGNVDMLRKFDAPGKLTTANPKRYNFEGNFLGKGDEGTLDEVMHAIMVSGEDAPLANGLDKKWLKKPFDKAHYPYYQEILGEIARDMGIDPRRLQEVAWSGFKKSSGNYKHAKPMIQIVNEAIARTSMVTGMPQKDVVRRALVRAEMPLYSNNPKAMAALGVTAQMLDPEDTARYAPLPPSAGQKARRKRHPDLERLETYEADNGFETLKIDDIDVFDDEVGIWVLPSGKLTTAFDSPGKPQAGTHANFVRWLNITDSDHFDKLFPGADEVSNVFADRTGAIRFNWLMGDGMTPQELNIKMHNAGITPGQRRTLQDLVRKWRPEKVYAENYDMLNKTVDSRTFDALDPGTGSVMKVIDPPKTNTAPTRKAR
jgi:hypothetical protein